VGHHYLEGKIMKPKLDSRMLNFANALTKVKKAYDAGQECNLSWLDTIGIIFGIRILSAKVNSEQATAGDSAESMSGAGATETNG